MGFKCYKKAVILSDEDGSLDNFFEELRCEYDRNFNRYLPVSKRDERVEKEFLRRFLEENKVDMIIVEYRRKLYIIEDFYDFKKFLDFLDRYEK
uniref:Uncharacterized protein n=1 Tax=candidate division WOR-3 bacterium TaxID=2052148 RepID=A0A7V3ZVG0_UNCW3